MIQELYTKEQLELTALHMLDYSHDIRHSNPPIEPDSEKEFEEYVSGLTPIKIDDSVIKPFKLPSFGELIDTKEKGEVFMASLKALSNMGDKDDEDRDDKWVKEILMNMPDLNYIEAETKIIKDRFDIDVSEGDYIGGTWQDGCGKTFFDEGVVKAYRVGLVIENINGITPLRDFIWITEHKKKQDENDYEAVSIGEELVRIPIVQLKTEYKYLIERTDTHQWFILNLNPYISISNGDHMGQIPNRENDWTSDANQAWQFDTRDEANTALTSLNHLPLDICIVTEHEFFNDKVVPKDAFNRFLKQIESCRIKKRIDYSDYSKLAEDCWLFLTDDSRPEKAEINKKAFIHEVKVMIETAVLFNQSQASSNDTIF